MEYTKDVLLNLHYKDNIGMMRLKKIMPLIKLHKFIQENKFITITLISVSIFVTIDIALVSSFINILAQI